MFLGQQGQHPLKRSRLHLRAMELEIHVGTRTVWGPRQTQQETTPKNNYFCNQKCNVNKLERML